MPRLIKVSKKMLSVLEKEARSLPRLRQTLSLSPDRDPVQKLVNVVCRGSYVRPHCHRPQKGKNSFELFTVLQGEIGILTFDSAGKITSSTLLSAKNDLTIEMPENRFHTVIALSSVAAILEVKQGPFNARTAKEFHQAFPEEYAPGIDQHMRAWRTSLRRGK